jgi:hypothetical protein
MPRFQPVGDLINRVAMSVGLIKTADPFASADPAFIQLCGLATEAGQDLVQECAWQQLERQHSFVTAPGDTGLYDLPADFGYMIDQTGWQQGVPGSAYPLLGPASSQWWSYLQASQLYTVTIYAWFRIADGKLQLWPQPPAVGIPIGYKYVSRDWARVGTSTPMAPVYQDFVAASADVPMFEPILFLKKLKVMWLQAKGFDTRYAQDEYILALDAWKGKDKSAPVLSLNGPVGFRARFINGMDNLPETGYGS